MATVADVDLGDLSSAAAARAAPPACVRAAKYGVWNRGSAGVMFLDWAPIFSYWGLSRGPGVALRASPKVLAN